MKKFILLLATLVYWQMASSQCLTNVDLNTWNVAGNPGNGNWVVQAGGSQVRQTINGSQTFFISPFDLINVRISGQFRTTDDDDDWMGFVFGFNDPITNTNNYDTWLFDWKHSAQGNAPEGKCLAYANGVITGQAGQYFGDHVAGPEFNIVATDFGGAAGWNRNTWHQFELVYTFTRAQIYIDGNLVFDHTDCFKPGRFGFYNRSQRDVYYGGFSYLLNTDFAIAGNGTCLGEPVDFIFVDACAAANYNPNVFNTFEWCYGDGTCETLTTPSVADVNRTHTYNTAGSFTVTLTVTDVNGCSSVATKTVNITEPPTAAFTTSDPCTSGGTVFTDASTGNYPLAAWSWDFGDNTTASVQNPPAHNYNSAGTYPITFVVEDNQGCTDTLVQNIDVLSTFVASSTTVEESCPGALDGEVDLTIALGTQPYTYIWDNTANTEDITGLANGDYTITFTDANGCTGTHTATVGLLPPLDITLTAFEYNGGVNISCPNASDGMINPVVTGGTFPYSYSWSNNATSQSVQGMPPGTHDLTVTDDAGCTATESIMLTPSTPVTSTITPNTFVGGVNVSCANASDGSVDLEVSGGVVPYTYSWDGGSQTVEDATGLNAGMHTVLITDDNGCTATDDVTLTEPDPLSISIAPTNPICYGADDGFAVATTTGGSGIYDYSWSSVDFDDTANYLIAGTHTVTVTDENGCTLDGSTTLGQPDPVTVSIAPVDTIIFGTTTELVTSFTANGNNIVTYEWNPPFSLSCADCPNPVAGNLFTTEFTVTVTDDDGCMGTASIVVPVNNDKIFFVPNAFSPNGDGVNDLFNVYAEGTSTVSGKIYDRWGELLYEIQDVNDGWDGMQFGELSRPGVYIYQVQIEYLDGDQRSQKGSFTLIR